MRPARLERATYGFEVRYSIRVSYRRLIRVDDGLRTRDSKIHNLELYP